LSTHPRTQPLSTSRTTLTSGQPTITDQHHTCSTPRATQLTTNVVPSSPPTSRIAPRPLTRASTRRRLSFQNYLPHCASESSSRSGMLCAHGALRHMPCGRYGASSRRERTFWHTLPSLTLIILAMLAAVWPRFIASSPHLSYKIPSLLSIISPFFPRLAPLSVNW
jgi:hypothetical protein